MLTEHKWKSFIRTATENNPTRKRALERLGLKWNDQRSKDGETWSTTEKGCTPCFTMLRNIENR